MKCFHTNLHTFLSPGTQIKNYKCCFKIYQKGVKDFNSKIFSSNIKKQLSYVEEIMQKIKSQLVFKF